MHTTTGAVACPVAGMTTTAAATAAATNPRSSFMASREYFPLHYAAFRRLSGSSELHCTGRGVPPRSPVVSTS